jgi:predicted AAA+ superfamily ATPase
MSGFYGRQRETGQLGLFLDAQGPGFTHLRGRRRIGKTELLKRIRDSRNNCFYFAGRDDENNRSTMKRFAKAWDAFVGERRLTRLRLAELSWDELFEEIGRHLAATSGAGPTILLLDEVQWLSKKGLGFCSVLKEHWGEWKKHGAIKLVIAGSSNRFFHEHTDGEMAVLRGLRTHATIWVRPFTLAEVKQHYFPEWTDEEVCLVYMMLGGVPYYLENVASDANFIRAVNKSIFCRGGIFLEEVDDLLKLEASQTGARARVKQILGSLGQDGATEATVVTRTGLSQAYVHATLERLLDYDLVHERRPLGRRKSNRSGVRFYMDDFYLNFYFQVLRPLESRIRGNERGLLFAAEVLGSKEGYYIPDFTGKAFELLIANTVKEGCHDESARTQRVFDKLGLRSGRYEWGTYWEQGRTQIDLVVAGLDDREFRIIEAKWISRNVDIASTYLDQLLDKRFDVSARRSWRRSDYLALSRGFSTGFRDSATARGVRIIDLADLF